jgi:hypothetical protein
MKPNINWVEEVHPQLSNNGHPVDGVLVGAGVLVYCGHKYPNKHKTNIKMLHTGLVMVGSGLWPHGVGHICSNWVVFWVSSTVENACSFWCQDRGQFSWWYLNVSPWHGGRCCECILKPLF